jgi:LuxR family transcriptional regulator, maltose regulon positive regulatory protein
MVEESIVSHASFAKITRPHYADLVPRKRLFKLLDDGRRQRITWVSAPPGAGKTALVSSYLAARRVQHLWYQLDRGDGDLPTFFHYLGLAAPTLPGCSPLPHLTPEYAADVPVFSRRYFEALGARAKSPFVLVFDDYHEVASETELHAALRDGIAALPRGMTIIVLSRSDPPAELARLRLNAQLQLVGWGELRLTLDEVCSIERLSARKGRRAVSHGDLHHMTQGWVGGLVLLLAQDNLHDSLRTPQGTCHRVLFDYFAGEVFANLEARVQRVLVVSALLKKMTARRVADLTGFPAAGELLESLNRGNYFTLKHHHAEHTYEYHPLFRGFLLARANQIFQREELDALRSKAATLLEAGGQIEDAAELLQALDDSHALAKLIVTHAPAFLEQGRSKVVETWLSSLPAEVASANPWLAYWQGMCRMQLQPAQALQCFEQAYARFKADGDVPGSCRAWCAIVDSLVFKWSSFKQLDRWIDEMSELLRAMQSPLDPAVDAQVACGMFIASMYRHQLPHVDRSNWERRVRQVVLHGTDAKLQAKVGAHLLLKYAWWVGDLASAELMLNTLRPQLQQEGVSPLMQTTWHVMAAGYYLMAAANEECIAWAERGLAIGQEAGVRTWDVLFCTYGAFASFSMDDTQQAESYLQRMQARLDAGNPMHQVQYCHLSGFLRAMQGALPSAGEMFQMAVTMAEDAGSCFLAALMRIDLGIILALTGQRDAGRALIEQSRIEGLALQSRTIEYMRSIAEAWLATEAGDEAACLDHLQRGFAVGALHRLYNHWWPTRVIARLYAKALTHGIEPEYVITAIRKRNVAPPADAPAPENWPWPLRIATLGGFRIMKEGQPLTFAGKSPRKPLQLLQALIAFGGTEVEQSSIVDALWPDLEGDNAQTAFDSTLYRLRKLLADEGAITLKSGRLSLNPSRVHVDILEVERLFDGIDAALAGASTEARIHESLATLLSVCAGEFLPGEAEYWALGPRERLRGRFLKTMQKLAAWFESRGAKPCADMEAAYVALAGARPQLRVIGRASSRKESR